MLFWFKCEVFVVFILASYLPCPPITFTIIFTSQLQNDDFVAQVNHNKINIEPKGPIRSRNQNVSACLIENVFHIKENRC